MSFDRTVWARRTRNVAIGFVVLMGIVGIVGFFVAPGIVKSVAEKQIAERTGRRATIGALALDPYVLSATIRDLKLYQPDGSTVAAEVGEIHADISSESLFRRALVFDELRVARPHLSITRLDPQRFDFSDVVDRLLAQPQSDEGPRFSLNNIRLDDGSIAFDDRVTGRTYIVEHITLGIPFVSNLPYATDVFVTPKFAADVNGSHVELNGKAQPFAKEREATLAFDIADLDVPTYMAFSPVPLRFTIAQATLSAHLVIDFRAADKSADADGNGRAMPQSLALSGHVDVTGLKITDGGSHEAISVERIDLDADRIDPLRSVVALKRIAITAPRVAATRRPDGSIDLVSLFAPPRGQSPPSTGDGPNISIATATVENGSLTVVDQTLAMPTETTFDAINATMEHVASQGDAPTSFAVSVRTPGDGAIEIKGDAITARRKVDGTVRMQHVRPGAFSPYVAGFLAARIGDGSIDATARYRIDASGATLAGRVDGISAHVTTLRSSLPNEKTAFVAADAIELEGGAYDLATRAFSADALTVTAPVVAVSRDAKGRWNLQAALVEKAATKAGTKPPAPTEHDAAIVVKTPDLPPFTALVKSLVVVRGDVTLEDDAQSVPMRLHVAPLNVRLANVGTAAGAIVPFSIDAGFERRGKLAIDGRLGVSPLTLDANVDASNVAVGWLAAYAGDRLNIVVDSADLNARGTLRMLPATGKHAADAMPGLAYRGSLGIVRLRAIDRVTSEEFVRWKTLDIPQVEFRLPPGNAPLSVVLGPVTVDDFYARVIVNSTGRLNLQDVVATPGQRQSVTTPEAEAKPAMAAAPTASPPTAAGPRIRVGGLALTNGRIGITDNFVKPNYSANLTDLAGEVSSIASDDPQPATVKLGGKIDGDGVVTVSGRINPLAATLYTDISAEAKDIDLTRLTPYAVKYAGYAIARGKLSTTVEYHIENGRLDARNRLFLDQLTFGEKVDSPTATKLPVLLAVSLLKNSRGEINVDLPVSGSLSDPEFSIANVIGRVLVNVLTRALASPFSLIGSAFGGKGAEELGYVEFEPGVSDLTSDGKAKLETLAKALADRPGLKLDIIGRFDPATDPEGIKRDHLLDRLKDLKAKELSKGGERVGRDDVTIGPGDYATYLARVYDDTRLPDKPRNVVGLAKAIPTEDMEKLLLADIKLDDNDPRWLAEARADVVRHTIEETGRISPSRVFLVTPKLNADGIGDKGAPNRVDFALR